MENQMEKSLGEFAHIPIWIEHPESEAHFVGLREDMDGHCVEVGYAIYGTEEEYQRIKAGGDLQELKGNILNMPDGIICHQVNCKGKMGAGLALAVRNKFPQVYDDYMRAYAAGQLKPGFVVWSKVGERLWVASLCGQDGYGRDKNVVYTQYDAVEACLNIVKATNVFPVAVPKGMGCNLANGDWDTVYGIVHKVLPHALIINHQEQQIIDNFSGSHHFLSNFQESPIRMILDEQQAAEVGAAEIVFKTVEHYYQAMKSPYPRVWAAIATLGTPGAAKRAGNGKPFTVGTEQFIVVLRPDWESVKLGIMESAVRAKFQIPELREKLLNTDGSEIIEGNTWGDTFWGVCKGKGENHLGKILMKVRGELKS